MSPAPNIIDKQVYRAKTRDLILIALYCSPDVVKLVYHEEPAFLLQVSRLSGVIRTSLTHHVGTPLFSTSQYSR